MTSSTKISNENIMRFLQELSNADDDQIKSGGCEIYDDGDKRFECGFFVKTQEICKAAANYLKELEQLNRVLNSSLELEVNNRDHHHEWADKLANCIAEILQVDIGEHSSANNPWLEALEAWDLNDNQVSLLQKRNKSLIEERQYWKEAYDQAISDLHSIAEQSRDGFARDFKGFISLDIHDDSEIGEIVYPLLDKYVKRKEGK